MIVPVINISPFDLPSYATEGSAGIDLRADLSRLPELKLVRGHFYHQMVDGKEVKCIRLQPYGGRAMIPTGLKIAVPKDHELSIQPRSGLAIKQGITVLNTPGCIDSDYRDEIKVILINTSNEVVTISHGDRIGQAILRRFEKITWNQVEILDTTNRVGGFGSTGVK